ncbi:MAG: GTP-binding protein [Reyranella sp.]|uniref:CobW family GTP-binding protein n=1 Tax=Reyranella sp. TaxID=1929291 RepID=UPI00273078A5|nr:GTP-binding protein [Reyranella sp.]MDP1964161.1 GTP-binding protein [Reyranella sp.]MDP2374986.1 GTP-binding protein [Reyranella sp.]
MSGPIPFTVIGGFLGAGKTTLLNRLLRGAEGRRFAVLVNDFGALDIDGGLVAAHGGDTIALANGCLCCTIGDSLVTTLLDLLERPERFDHIVVEASGVADPGRIADLAVLEPRLSRDGVIVVVDAAQARERAADRRLGDTVMRQIQAADLLLLNKTDLAPDLAAVRCWLSMQAAAPILEACRADVPLDLLFGLDRHGATAALPPSDRFESWSYQWPEPVERADLLAMLREAPGEILRAKGIVRFADAPDRRAVVHLVGRRLDVSDEGPWGDTAGSRLVMLGFRPVLGSLPRE